MSITNKVPPPEHFEVLVLLSIIPFSLSPGKLTECTTLRVKAMHNAIYFATVTQKRTLGKFIPTKFINPSLYIFPYSTEPYDKQGFTVPMWKTK